MERLRRLCLALPEVVEKPSHGEPTWFAGKGRVFATLDDHHHRAEHLSVWLPLPFGAQEALVERDPEHFFRPPYVGARGWVAVVLDDDPDWGAVKALLREAYLKVATKRLSARLLGMAPPVARGSRRSGLRGLRPGGSHFGRLKWKAHRADRGLVQSTEPRLLLRQPVRAMVPSTEPRVRPRAKVRRLHSSKEDPPWPT